MSEINDLSQCNSDDSGINTNDGTHFEDEELDKIINGDLEMSVLSLQDLNELTQSLEEELLEEEAKNCERSQTQKEQQLMTNEEFIPIVEKEGEKNEKKKETKPIMNDKFTENLSNALREVEIGIDNNYIIKMQEINEKREEVLKNKEKIRREMAEHRYIEAMLQKQHIDHIRKKRRFTYLNTLNDKKPNNDNEKQINENKNKSSGHTVVVENLALITNEYSISAICQTVGPIKSCSIELANGKRKAIAKFVSRGDAALFQRRFHNFKLDSNVIRTRII
jgi:hypothetical protein